MFKALFEDARRRDAFHVEEAILQFTSDLHQLMKNRGLNKAELARVLGTTPAYITKIFRGDANFTIESMIRLSRALGGHLHIELKPDPAIAEFTPPPRPSETIAACSIAREAPSTYRARTAKVPVSINSRSSSRATRLSGKTR
ncbi:MAG: helix-turn-helix domain-containing protein [Candidatus Methylomirabilia bacterium]